MPTTVLSRDRKVKSDLEGERLVSPYVTADILGVCPRTVYTLMGDGRLAYSRIGSQRRISLQTIREYVAANQVVRAKSA